jgi:hypothetical protein
MPLWVVVFATAVLVVAVLVVISLYPSDKEDSSPRQTGPSREPDIVATLATVSDDRICVDERPPIDQNPLRATKCFPLGDRKVPVSRGEPVDLFIERGTVIEAGLGAPIP